MTTVNELLTTGCKNEERHKLCRTRGGESCAFDGAFIVLNPIADAAHIVHGPIGCLISSWRGRGALSDKGDLDRLGISTSLTELDIIYGAEKKLFRTIRHVSETIKPKAIFVYATCVSGLIGEDIERVCRDAGQEFGVRVIAVNCAGFTGPKNLGNRIAGDALLKYVIGTGTVAGDMSTSVNLIGEYNIAGDLGYIEPLFEEAGIGICSRITGNASFDEITYANRAALNVVVCGRALINVATEMEKRYGIPYIEVSFYGMSETSKALLQIASALKDINPHNSADISANAKSVIYRHEHRVYRELSSFRHLRGLKAILYTGGVKSWSIISALIDIGITVVAVGIKKSTFDDVERMKEILGEDAPLYEDVTPRNLRRLMLEKKADILIAGGRNLLMAMKEGIPFVDVNQERHTPYAGYEGLMNLATDIDRTVGFFKQHRHGHLLSFEEAGYNVSKAKTVGLTRNPIRHPQHLGAIMAIQGIDTAIPVLHGAQGCAFLSKAMLAKHFREPISLLSTKLFTEDIVMNGGEVLVKNIEGLLSKDSPELIAILSTGLTEVKGDDIAPSIERCRSLFPQVRIIEVSTPDYEGSMEEGYAKTLSAIIESIKEDESKTEIGRLVNVLVGAHLTPADSMELRSIMEQFDLMPIIIPDMSAMDGSRDGFSGLTSGGTNIETIDMARCAQYTIAIGRTMLPCAKLLKKRFGIDYMILDSVMGLTDTDNLMETLSMLGERHIPSRFSREKRILVDTMRDNHHVLTGMCVAIAADNDISVQISRCLKEMEMDTVIAVVPLITNSSEKIIAKKVLVGDYYTVLENCSEPLHLLISNSHGSDIAARLCAGFYETGFPVYGDSNYLSRLTIGYKGAAHFINRISDIVRLVKGWRR